ncbi:Methionine synthase II (cobalamin-independent) (plasmid) [Rubrobacter radiotolerans]|uniref:Methionine synthase II (Cobalamin-independent) n=2 Tax=Rubrobacter radiotolerans TaxID=42256 RepID=A0A023X885_RUBRA|nr:Methionine synthase II (cobalamin-independent) [Rubrobacter radiotolerans]SMC01476.1 5-methyltetrahydropteroyltriglutamate--homocysteine methyltransferase [Rubrobacter radiotolerans DSM 5868]
MMEADAVGGTLWRADVVGSLLRPEELLRARERHARDELPTPEFKTVEDRAVESVIRMQERVGLDVVTDGELRRESFQSQMVEATEGFGESTLDAYLWGDWRGEGEVGDRRTERPAGMGVTGKLRRRRFLSVEEFVFARGATDRTVKVTLPSPSLYANFWDPERSREAYPTLDGFLEDVAELLREEVRELVRLGATYLQLDAPHYPLLLDGRTRRFYEERGWSLDRWLSRGIELDNHVIGGRGPGSDVTFAFHLCRGNQGSRWLVAGSYEPLAERIFGSVAAERLMLEYDDERSGDFSPLTHVPPDKVAVLGLVTTKSGRVETEEDLTRRIREASAHVPLERLAISPQCGFATSVIGNALSPEDQERKLETLVRTARAVWGDG